MKYYNTDYYRGMNYNLENNNVEFDIDIGMRYGDMPSAMLVNKFEQTDIVEPDDVYDSYARNTITNWGPDVNLLEHEEARGGVNKASGRLQLQYYGHRGNCDQVYRPEIFDGFGGPDDRDPRGINPEPDMKNLRSQHESRMRFTRFSKDHDDSCTGGGRSEGALMADQQQLFKQTKSRLKVFSAQREGRDNPLTRRYSNRSTIPKQIVVQSYGDKLQQTIGLQKRARIITGAILRDSRQYRTGCTDQAFTYANYSQLRRPGAYLNKHKRVLSAQSGEDMHFASSDQSKCFKAAALLMSNIVKERTQVVSNARASDREFSTSSVTVVKKTAPFRRDLTTIMQSVSTDNKFTSSDITQYGKTQSLQRQRPLMEMSTRDNLTPAHHYHNAEILYKSVKPGADMRKVKNAVITDASDPVLSGNHIAKTGKTARRRVLAGAKLAVTNDAEYSQHTTTFSYKSITTTNGDRRIRLVSGENYKKESDNTQTRRTDHTKYRISSVDDVVSSGIKFSNNDCPERHGGHLGNKYMTRFIDRDGRSGQLDDTN